MSDISLGDLNLGTGHPAVAAIIDEKLPVSDLKDFCVEGADIFEIRADLIDLENEELDEFLNSVKQSVDVPLIGTMRGGAEEFPDRLKKYEILSAYCEAVDVDMDSGIIDRVRDAAYNRKLIISKHDYKKTPDAERMTQDCEEALKHGADIVKLAYMAQNKDDLRRLLFATDKIETPVVSISMGRIGAVSRIIAPLFGSLFTYAFVKRPVAPGQFMLNDTVGLIKKFYPDSGS